MIVQWYNPLTTIKPPPQSSSLYHIHLKNRTELLYTCSTTTTTKKKKQNQDASSLSSSSSSMVLSLTSWMVQWSDVQKYHPDIIHSNDTNNDHVTPTIVPVPIDTYRQTYDTLHPVILFPQISDHFEIHPSHNSKDTIFYNHWYQHPLSDALGIQVRLVLIYKMIRFTIFVRLLSKTHFRCALLLFIIMLNKLNCI
jgi:hypothetical protein